MLEDAKNSLPQELSNRFDMNRFFANTRDVINDELQANVPDLIEDALENPTGTYKQISRFQNEKLMDIDRTGLRIEEKLDDILSLIGKISGKGGDGEDDGSWLDDLIAGLLGGLGGRGRKNKTKNNKKNKKTKKGKGNKPTGTKKKSGFKFKGRGIGGALTAILATAGTAIGASILYDIASEDYSTEDVIDGLASGEYNDVLTDLGVYTAIGAVPTVTGLLTQAMGGKPPAPAAPAPNAPQGKPTGGAVRRSELPQDHPKYKAPGGKVDKFGNAGSYVSAEEAANYKPKGGAGTPKPPSAVPKPPSAPGFFSRAGSYLSSSVGNMASNSWEYVKDGVKGWKTTAYIAAAYACYDFYVNLTNLPPDLTEEEYRKEVGRLARETVAITGLTMFSAFVSSIVAGAAGAFFFGVGSIPAAAAGFLGGLIGGSLAESFIGEEVRDAVNSPAIAGFVDAIVSWIISGIEMAKSAMTPKQQNNKLSRHQSTDEFANLSDEQLQAKGLKKLPKKFSAKGGTSQYNEYEVVDQSKYKPSASPAPASTPAATSTPTASPNDQYKGYTLSQLRAMPDEEREVIEGPKVNGKWMSEMTPEERVKIRDAAKQVNDMMGSNEKSPTDWMNPQSVFSSIAASIPGGIPGADMGALTGLGKSAASAGLAASGQLSASAIFGEGGAGKLLGMLGAKSITPEDAVKMGMVEEGDTEGAKAAAEKYNAMLGPQLSQQSSVDQSRAIAAAMPAENPFADMGSTIANHLDSVIKATASRETVAAPSFTVSGFPQFSSTPHPTSLAVVALRAQGMADVYAHPQSGATMQRMDRGGETLLG